MELSDSALSLKVEPPVFAVGTRQFCYSLCWGSQASSAVG